MAALRASRLSDLRIGPHPSTRRRKIRQTRSARMPRVLRWARALPSLRTLLLRRGLATVDDQAVALSSALAAYGAVPQSRSTAALAGRRQFFIHLGSLLSQAGNTCRLAFVPARDKLPKGMSRPVRREAAGQIKQIIVSRRTVRRQPVMESLYEKVANPIPRVPRQVPDRVSIFRGRLFPRVGRT
jgi:hypothetical protein